MSKNLKVKDTGLDISSNSRLDRYWRTRGFELLYRKMRKPAPPLKGTETVQELYQMIISDFSFAGVEFGNWVTNEARFNYLVASVVALQDISRVLKFPNKNIGLNKIGLAIGARGQGGALAHFEPGSFIINLTRFGRDEEFGFSGGVGSLAHEYGHALDYFFGTYHAPAWEYRSLTMGRKVTTTFDGQFPKENTLQGVAHKIIKTIIWKDFNAGEKTSYYQKLIDKKGGTDYWFRHNELFARSFEQYISYKLSKSRITNFFLTKHKYTSDMYLDQALLKKVVPLFDKLILMMKSKTRK